MSMWSLRAQGTMQAAHEMSEILCTSVGVGQDVRLFETQAPSGVLCSPSLINHCALIIPAMCPCNNVDKHNDHTQHQHGPEASNQAHSRCAHSR